MRRRRSAADRQIADLLPTARRSLGMSVAFLSRTELTTRDGALIEILAAAAAAVLEPGVQHDEHHSAIRARLLPVIADGGPDVVVQSIVDLATGRRVGAEALSRFPAAWGLAPDAVFAEAHEVGVGDRLEVLALYRAADLLDQLPGYVSMNVSAGTLLTPDCR